MSDMAGSLRRQLKGDLLLAMKAKDIIAISALRSVLSALDNASAVPQVLLLPRSLAVAVMFPEESSRTLIARASSMARLAFELWLRKSMCALGVTMSQHACAQSRP